MSKRISTSQNVVVGELSYLSRLTRDAVVSGGWCYPLLGIGHLLSHPSLFRSITPLLLKCTSISLGITTAMFALTYFPQVAFCAIFSGPFAFVAAFALVLSESYAMILFVSKVFFLGPAQDQIFDAILVQQGHEQLVSRGREVRSRSGIKSLGKSITKPLNRFSKEGVFRYLVSLPLNALPVVGTILFLLYNGVKAGPGFHARYFQLKGLSVGEREAFVHKQRGAYTGFGAMALALNLVPLAGLAFNFSSVVGAALWASALERKSGDTSQQVPVAPVNDVETSVELE